MADAVHGALADHGLHGHDHPAHLQHHFESEAQQFDASKLGMWLFLVTEILFFSGLFCAYAVYRANHPQIFEVGHHFLDVKWGAINTVVLILSSFTMALGVWCAQRSKQTGLIVCLILTLAGAAGFMGIKFVEYKDKLEHGKVWGAGFNAEYHGDGHEGGDNAPAADHGAPPHAAAAHADAAHGASATEHATSAPVASAAATPAPAAAAAPSGPAPIAMTAADLGLPADAEMSTVKLAPAGPQGMNMAAVEKTGDGHHKPSKAEIYAQANSMRDIQIFMGIYFCMTGLHGIHVLAGMVVITWILIGAIKGKYNSEYYTPVDLVGLYWHVVDLIWIYLFPLLYLIH
jgi:cytochrome c oxidase subunit 3